MKDELEIHCRAWSEDCKYLFRLGHVLLACYMSVRCFGVGLEVVCRRNMEDVYELFRQIALLLRKGLLKVALRYCTVC